MAVSAGGDAGAAGGCGLRRGRLAGLWLARRSLDGALLAAGGAVSESLLRVLDAHVPPPEYLDSSFLTPRRFTPDLRAFAFSCSFSGYKYQIFPNFTPKLT